jgi:hypothetical protein
VNFLVATSVVLFARILELNIDILESKRQAYVRLREVMKDFAVVDVSQPVDTVASQVCDLIVNFRQNKDNIRRQNQWSNR